MNRLDILTVVAAEHGGIIRNKDAEAVGISRAMLCKLNKEEKILRITQGQYIIPTELQDELLSISMRSNNLILSHETALWLHGISDRTPFVHSVTAPTGKIPSKAIQRSCKVYYIKPELFKMGICELTTPSGNTVLSYNLERTICDCVRSRNKISSETFLTALKAYACRKDKNLNQLYTYAEKMRISHVIRKYLEVLL